MHWVTALIRRATSESPARLTIVVVVGGLSEGASLDHPAAVGIRSGLLIWVALSVTRPKYAAQHQVLVKYLLTVNEHGFWCRWFCGDSRCGLSVQSVDVEVKCTSRLLVSLYESDRGQRWEFVDLRWLDLERILQQRLVESELIQVDPETVCGMNRVFHHLTKETVSQCGGHDFPKGLRCLALR